ncbi:disintegrin and metalloproteinase domain-containing protein 9-like isoform X1 [Oculina patagonica]
MFVPYVTPDKLVWSCHLRSPLMFSQRRRVEMTKQRSLIFCAFTFLLTCACFNSVEGAYEDNYHITYPERIDGSRERRDLSTSEKGGHMDEASYQLNAFDKDWTLDIKRNKELIPASFTVRTFANDGSEVIEQGASDHCHYQGNIRGLKDSSVVLNTCSGLRGIIDDGKNAFYITPKTGKKNKGAHRVFKAKEEDFNDICDTAADFPSKVYARTSSGLPDKVSDTEKVYKPYLKTKTTRYNELVLVVDNEMYKNLNKNKKDIKDRLITMANAVDAIYQRINIRIVLKAVEIWTNGDPFKKQVEPGDDLKLFRGYRENTLLKKISHDNAHLMRGSRWPGYKAVGIASVFGMCKTTRSAGLVRWKEETVGSEVVGPYIGLAHEMGHNFGFPHDDKTKCTCLTPSRGCIMMGGGKGTLPGFSDCNMETLGNKKLDDSCLYNVPTYKSENGYCGNGIREEGEECDCGTKKMCRKKDPCCEPYNCVNKKGCRDQPTV